MKPKLLLLSILASLAILANSQGQTSNGSPVIQVTSNTAPVISGPAYDLFNFLTTEGATNWMAATYATYESGNKSWGGGVAALYEVSPFVAPMMRVDYVRREFWMPSASLQLQLPVTVMGKFTLVPFGFTGIAVPFNSDNNDPVVGIFGIGGALRIYGRWDAVVDYEKWTSFTGHQIRFGILYRF